MPSSEPDALTCPTHATVLTLLQPSPKVKPLALFGRYHFPLAAASNNFMPFLNASGVMAFLYTPSVVSMDL